MTGILLIVSAAAAVASLVLPMTAPIRILGSWGGIILGFGAIGARLLAPGRPRDYFFARALFLGPLMAGVLAMAGLALGVSVLPLGRLLVITGYAVGFLSLLRRRTQPETAWDLRLALWIAILVALVLLPHGFREAVRDRSDAWFHEAVVTEIMARGIPPGDPYFAGVQLNYPWFFHALLAPWAAVAEVRAWDLGGALNAGWLAAMVGAVFALSRRLGRSAREAFFAALFVPLGLESLFTLWLPLKVARGLVGETGGWEHVEHLLSLRPFMFEQVLHVTSTWGSVPPMINKFLVMTVFSGSLAAFFWVVEGLIGLVAAFGSGPTGESGEPDGQEVATSMGIMRSRWWWWSVTSIFALWMLHAAVGLVLLLGATVAALLLLTGIASVERRVVVAGAGAAILGTLAAAPMILATAGRADASVFGFDLFAVRAILIGSTAALLFGIPGLRRAWAGSSAARFFVLLAFGTSGVSLFVSLPHPNTIDKMSFLFYLLPAVAAGWWLGRWWETRRGKTGRAVAVVLLVLLLAPITSVFWLVHWHEPGRPSVAAEEIALYDYLRTRTPRDAVILDTAERVDVLIHAERRQYWGREPYSYQWGYRPQDMTPRRSVRDALMTEGTTPGADRWDGAMDRLEAFAASGTGPVFVLWRAGDHGGVPYERTLFAADQERFERVWRNPAAAVLRFHPTGNAP